MPHQYHLRCKKDGYEWLATAHQGQKEVARAYALTREEAIEKVKKVMPPDKRFKITHGKTTHVKGEWVRVKDYQNGDVWEASHWNNWCDALEKIEPDLPKAYFYEKHGEGSKGNARNEWSGHHVFKSFGIPVIVMSAIVWVIMYFNGAFH